jgi:hypothetical protein
MGMKTRLYGCIEEYGLNIGEFQDKIYSHNERIISELPIEDNWPPLTKNMFSITKNLDSNVNHEYCGRTIHFGGNYKSIDDEWIEWKNKFENLLQNLLWTSAEVHFKNEFCELQTFSWKIDLKL